jgi:hypothetical protein
MGSLIKARPRHTRIVMNKIESSCTASNVRQFRESDMLLACWPRDQITMHHACRVAFWVYSQLCSLEERRLIGATSCPEGTPDSAPLTGGVDQRNRKPKWSATSQQKRWLPEHEHHTQNHQQDKHVVLQQLHSRTLVGHACCDCTALALHAWHTACRTTMNLR